MTLTESLMCSREPNIRIEIDRETVFPICEVLVGIHFISLNLDANPTSTSVPACYRKQYEISDTNNPDLANTLLISLGTTLRVKRSTSAPDNNKCEFSTFFGILKYKYLPPELSVECDSARISNFGRFDIQVALAPSLNTVLLDLSLRSSFER